MRGILFNDDYNLLQQVFSGRKTETRRTGGLEVLNEAIDNGEEIIMLGKGCLNKNTSKFEVEYVINWENVSFKSRYKLGEILYLKESYRWENPNKPIEYKLINPKKNNSRRTGKFLNKLFMPASASRAKIVITDIRFERISDITEQAVYREGIPQVMLNSMPRKPSPTVPAFVIEKPTSIFSSKKDFTFHTDHKAAFLDLVNRVNSNKKKPIKADHYVFVYTFSLL